MSQKSGGSLDYRRRPGQLLRHRSSSAVDDGLFASALQINAFWHCCGSSSRPGCVDHGLFRAASEGVPQGGVISPLLSNIMLL